MLVTSKSVAEFGCPHCGMDMGRDMCSPGSSVLTSCPVCKKGFSVVGEGTTETGFSGGPNIKKPVLQEHPRKGTPKHGMPDVKPDDGGEFFGSRGIGRELLPACYICPLDETCPTTERHHLLYNISGYVRSKEGGERIVAMFGHGAKLDYRDFEPWYIQLKVGTCEGHQPGLELLHRLTRENGIITDAMIAESRGLPTPEELFTFSVGKFYRHTSGKQMAVIGDVTSTQWGETLVAESNKGNLIPVGRDAASATNWVEIDEAEWKKNFS